MKLSNEHGRRALSGGNDDPFAIPVVMGVTTPETQAVPITPAAPMPAARSVEVVAPTALAGGYQFHVDDAEANRPLLVEVVRIPCLGCVYVYMIFLRILHSEYSVRLGVCACMYVCAFREKNAFVPCIIARDTY
jgi:hypothetical protein